ncbi:hypothetical protein [Streptomyces sp. NBC_00690]|uniref:hypothetical protein n=1 Tax=Streptomyces sp. NBC_00690 TaxID=2975808 RepID=UPI002E2CDDD4|nr:hypothetical protein [Streptomyces sp. NBC_00690]
MITEAVVIPEPAPAPFLKVVPDLPDKVTVAKTAAEQGEPARGPRPFLGPDAVEDDEDND